MRVAGIYSYGAGGQVQYRFSPNGSSTLSSNIKD